MAGKKDGFFDLGGTIYALFLHFMLVTQSLMTVRDGYNGDYLYFMVHLFASLYFILRIHIFCKIMDKANSSGHSIVDYLRQKYGT